MAEFRDLTAPQQRLVRTMYVKVMEGVNQDDPTGHMPNCGYTENKPSCDCFETGIRVRQAIIDTVASHTPFPKE